MKNLITYSLDNPSDHEEIDEYLRLQVSNSLRLGWSVNNIVLYTNWAFEYRGVVARQLEIKNKSRFSKWYGIREVLAEGHSAWNHDHDGWQIFPIPHVEHGRAIKAHIYKWAYINDSPAAPMFCSGSIFLLPTALPFVEKLINYENRNNIKMFRNSDEVLLCKYLIENPEDLPFFDQTLGKEFCFSAGKDEARLNETDLPLRYLHCKFAETICHSVNGMKICLPADFVHMFADKFKFSN